MLKTIDLFAGIGGIRKGFELTQGFETVYANDSDKHCKTTYDANFEDTQLSLKDIRKVSVLNGDIPEFDFLLAGFPCQPFSVGAHGKGFLDHKGRGTLFEEIERILAEHADVYGTLPMGFMLENVKNLQSHDGHRTFRVIREKLENLGYTVDAKVYNSLSFGVAQSRERIYIVGFRSADLMEHFHWPEATHAPENYVRITDILDSDVGPQYYYNDKPLYKKIGHLVTNPNMVYTYRRNYVREHPRGFAPTLVASMGLGGHNVPLIRDGKGMRRLTPKECAKLQGFYDMHLPVSVLDAHQYKQIGNSVSVPVIRAVAGQILEATQSLAAHAASIEHPPLVRA